MPTAASGPVTRADLEPLAPAEARRAVRAGDWVGTSKRLALGYEQANVTIVPERCAFDFMRFCQRNPKPLPLIEVTDPGNPEPAISAPGADLRTDVPAYRVYRDGEPVEDLVDIRRRWRDDHVAFLTGCNLSVDQVMLAAGIELPHLTREDAWTSQYVSAIQCRPAGVFRGPLVVSMRPIARHLVVKAIEITSRFPRSHGAPVNVGDPEEIGVHDLDRVDWGKPNPIGPGEVPVFWACGITAQAVARAIRLPEMITHRPGHMFVTDIAVSDPTRGTS